MEDLGERVLGCCRRRELMKRNEHQSEAWTIGMGGWQQDGGMYIDGGKRRRYG